MSIPDSLSLIARLKAKPTRDAAFAELMEQHQQRLYHHIRRMLGNHDDADDALQNTFIKAWKALDNFRGDAKLHTWLYRIATNEALTCIKKRKRHPLADTEDHLVEEASQASLHAFETLSATEIQQKLQAALDILPERQLTVFNLRYFDEMPYEQISEVLGVTQGALKASYHHAVKKVENHLRASL